MGSREGHLAHAVKLRKLAAECRALSKIAADDLTKRKYLERADDYEALAEEVDELAERARHRK